MKAQDLAALNGLRTAYFFRQRPVNFAGMIAENVLSGLSEVHFERLKDALLLDTRGKR